MALVSCAVIDWHTPRLAQRARGSILSLYPDREVFVVDAAALGLGYGAAVNHTERMADPAASIFLACNADVALLSDDEALLKLFSESPRLAAVGPRQVDGQGRLVHAGIVSETGRDDGYELDLHHRYWRSRDRWGGTEPYLEVPMVAGSVMYWRREAFREVGGLGEYPFFYEETIAAYRVRRRGWKVAYSALALWLHLHASSPLAEGRRQELLEESRELFLADCEREGIALSDLPAEAVCDS